MVTSSAITGMPVILRWLTANRSPSSRDRGTELPFFPASLRNDLSCTGCTSNGLPTGTFRNSVSPRSAKLHPVMDESDQADMNSMISFSHPSGIDPGLHPRICAADSIGIRGSSFNAAFFLPFAWVAADDINNIRLGDPVIGIPPASPLTSIICVPLVVVVIGLGPLGLWAMHPICLGGLRFVVSGSLGMTLWVTCSVVFWTIWVVTS